MEKSLEGVNGDKMISNNLDNKTHAQLSAEILHYSEKLRRAKSNGASEELVGNLQMTLYSMTTRLQELSAEKDKFAEVCKAENRKYFDAKFFRRPIEKAEMQQVTCKGCGQVDTVRVEDGEDVQMLNNVSVRKRKYDPENYQCCICFLTIQEAAIQEADV